ncbi:hypothetical protein A3Q56_04586 [Intoshia linei]|uniref:Uncharacterized protein n=1 Tax=Intoshia linei TaxID=1819745 RepID=A0A177B231_9BILA|nr:hypothetical protein A3Q56_04586 [Intoshia linei]
MQVCLSLEQRKTISEHFWMLDDMGKRMYYGKYTEKIRSVRTIGKNRKKYSYRFFLKASNIYRCCKRTFLDTLDISQRRVSYYHDHTDTITNLPELLSSGDHVKHRISVIHKPSARSH